MSEYIRILKPATAGSDLASAARILDEIPALDAAGGPVGALTVALAWLAAGRAHRVRSALRTIEPDLAHLVPLLVGRYVAWTGDLRSAALSWPAVRQAAECPAQNTGGTDERIIAAATVVGLERTATDMGDPALAARLRAPARDARMSLHRGAGSTLLALALDVEPDPAQAWTGDGHTRLASEQPLDAARFVLAAVHGLLGISPDATRHRVWLRPRGVFDGEGLDVREIRVGDDSLNLRVDATGDRLRVTVEQDAGPIPITALLEPLVPGTVRQTAVDGVDARLAVRPAPGGSVVPVQLVLDHARTLEIERVAPAGNAEGPPTT
ncbi:MAG TPA: hypothetical protein VK936_12725 [Longimicrobiales bacterium]|nr:hypothetical protein [Longimicrobiales bacterium]